MNHVLAVHIRIQPQHVEAFMRHVTENALATRKEPGCRQFEVLADPEDRTKILLFEIYDDLAAFEAHQQTPHFKRYLEVAVPLLAARERTFWRKAA